MTPYLTMSRILRELCVGGRRGRCVSDVARSKLRIQVSPTRSAIMPTESLDQQQHPRGQRAQAYSKNPSLQKPGAVINASR